MDIEKLIEQLRTESLYKDKATLEIMDLCMEAADAIEKLEIELQAMRCAANSLKAHLEQAEKKNDEYLRRRAAQEEERRRGCWWCNGIGATPENWECSLVGEFGTVTTTDNEVVWTTASFCPSCGRRLKENEDG